MSLQKAQRRGTVDFNWLKGHHYFSFGNYYNPMQINFGLLNVFSHYQLMKQEEFEKSKVKNMDIITVLLKGDMRQNNSIEERVTLKEGQLIHLQCGEKEIEYQNQNTSEQVTSEFLQIYITNEEKQENQMKILDLPQQNDNLNKIVEFLNMKKAKLSVFFVEKNKVVSIECQEAQNALYIVLLNGQTTLDNSSLQQQQFCEGDALLGKQGQGIKITGVEEVSKGIIVEVDYSTHKQLQNIE